MAKRRTPIERFLSFVEICADGCHRWTGCIDQQGYGKFKVGSTTLGTARTVLTHKWYYEYTNGPVPDGLELDHKCRQHDCVNLDHIEPVTRRINQKRGTNGRQFPLCAAELHAMEGANLIIRRDGKRNCRACKNSTLAAWRRIHRKSRSKKNLIETNIDKSIGSSDNGDSAGHTGYDDKREVHNHRGPGGQHPGISTISGGSGQ